MMIHHSLDHIPLLPSIALAIGSFDGVHLGHQYLFEQLKKHGTPVVLTFSNHPSQILRPSEPILPILTLDEKLELFEQCGIEMTIVVAFTHALSQIPYDQFLAKIPFSILMGGQDLRLGWQGKGTHASIQALGYKTLSLPKFTFEEVTPSSSFIRELIKTHQFDQAHKWLGHTKGSLWQASPVES